MNLKELASNDKPYYGSGTHVGEHDTFKNFFEEMNDYDVDMNLCYRFDILQNDDKTYRIDLFTILQREGRCIAHYVKVFKEEDLELLKKYLEPHQKVCKQLINF